MSVAVTVFTVDGKNDTIVVEDGFSIETEQAEGGGLVLNVHDVDGGLLAIFRDWRYAIADYTTPDDDEVDGAITSITARIAA